MRSMLSRASLKAGHSDDDCAHGNAKMIRLLAMIFVGLLAAGAAAAQSGDAACPDRPVRLIVPFPAGSSTDIISRILAQRLGARLGQQVVIDNRGGASGNLGADAIAK